MEFASQISDNSPRKYRDFWRLWAVEDYYAGHEILEALWREETGPNKLFYQGLIHCAVAMYQARRGNAVGANRQLLRARFRLGHFEPEWEGVTIAGLLEYVEREVLPLRETMTAGQRAGLDRLARELERRFPAGQPPHY